MPITLEQKNELDKLIKNYTESAIADSWAGSADPEDYESIVQSCTEAKEELNAFVESITEVK